MVPGQWSGTGESRTSKVGIDKQTKQARVATLERLHHQYLSWCYKNTWYQFCQIKLNL